MRAGGGPLRSLPPVTAVALAFAAGIGLDASGLPLPGTVFLTGAGCLIPLFLRPLPGPHGRTRAAWRTAVAAALLGVLAAGVLHGRAAPDPAPRGSRAEARGAAAADSSWSVKARAALSARIERRFPEEGGIVAALLLAERDGVDRELRDAFRRSGTSHLLAISGFHVGVIAGWIVLLLRLARRSRRAAAGGAVVLVWGYVALLGFPGSAVRAATIFALVAAGRAFGRPVLGVGAWGSALLLISLARPHEVLGIGTRLSFLGALGLLLWATPWADRLGEAFDRRGWGGHGRARTARDAVLAAVAASAAAQWATLPLAAGAFQQVALAGLPTTLLATPLVSFALPGALLTLALDVVHLPGAGWAAAGVEGLLAALRMIVEAGGRHGPLLHLSPWTVGCAVATAVLAPGLLRRLRPGRRRPPGLVFVVTVVAALLATPLRDGVAAHLPNTRSADLHFLDVGQGDAILIRTPRGRWILVDTGPPSLGHLNRELLRLGVGRIDLLVLSHPDLDHIGGAAAVLRTFPVGAVLDPGAIRGGRWRELLEIAEARGVPWRRGAAGDRFRLGGARLAVISPGPAIAGTGPEAPPNDRSIVLHLQIGDFDALLTGDIPVEVERALLPSLVDVELLKVAHHGSRTSTAPEFLQVVRPEIAVVQVGRRNRFGHPVPEVVDRLEAIGAELFRTDRDGRVTVRVTADGRSWRIDRERAGAAEGGGRPDRRR